jgi:hypothetical protein
MIRVLNYLINVLTRLRDKLKGDSGDTSQRKWLKGYSKWKDFYK